VVAVTHFFGRPAAVSRAPALLAMRAGASVVTGATYSVDRRSLLTFLSVYEAPLWWGHARARVDALTRALVADIEALIAAHPEQWHVPADLTQLPWLEIPDRRCCCG
jgi:lauroyl/myristoyl acyltransferase